MTERDTRTQVYVMTGAPWWTVTTERWEDYMILRQGTSEIFVPIRDFRRFVDALERLNAS